MTTLYMEYNTGLGLFRLTVMVIINSSMYSGLPVRIPKSEGTTQQGRNNQGVS